MLFKSILSDFGSVEAWWDVNVKSFIDSMGIDRFFSKPYTIFLNSNDDFFTFFEV